MKLLRSPSTASGRIICLAGAILVLSSAWLPAQQLRMGPATLGPGVGQGRGRPSEPTQSDEPPTPVEKALTFSLGEFFQLGPDPNIKKIKDVFLSRTSIIQLVPVERNSVSVRAFGKGLGTVMVTVVGDDGKIVTYLVRITPSLTYLRELAKRLFPEANLQISAAGDNIILVEGTVDAPDQVAPIIKFLQGFSERGGEVINGIRVTGVVQVQLQVCIAKVNRDAMRRLGVNFLRSEAGNFVGSQPGNVMGVPTIAARGATAGNASTVFTNFNGSGTSGVLGPNATVFFGVTQLGSSFFGFLDMLMQEGQAKILATPTLVTLNGRPADFLVGGEQPIPVVTGTGGSLTPTVDYKAFGTRLTFVPTVLGNGKIRLNLIPEVSRLTTETVLVGGTQVPRFETQRLNATVEMENGQTLALGGLIQTEEEATVHKVPFLGDIPYFGVLFRSITHLKRETELLVLITPHLVDPLSGCGKPTTVPGQESRSPNDAELFFRGEIEVPVGMPSAKHGRPPGGDVSGQAAPLPPVTMPPQPTQGVPPMPVPDVPSVPVGPPAPPAAEPLRGVVLPERP